MRNQIFLSLTAVLFLSLTSCTKKEVPLKDHATGAPQEVTSPRVEASALEAQVKSFDLEQLRLINTQGTLEEVKAQVYQPLQTLLFTSGVLDHLILSRTDQVRYLFIEYNRALDRILREDKTDLPQTVLTQYAAQAFTNCSDEYAPCSRWHIYSSSPSLSAEIMISAAQPIAAEIEADLKGVEYSARGYQCSQRPVCSGLLRNYFRHLLMAFSMQPSLANPRLRDGYMKYGSLYGDQFVYSTDRARADREFRKHRLAFQLARAISVQAGESQEFLSFIDQPATFQYSATRGSPFDETYFLEAIPTLLYRCPQAGVTVKECKQPLLLGTSFQTAADTLLSRTSGLVKPGGAFAVKNMDQLTIADVQLALKNQKIVLENFELDPAFAADEYFFLVNGLFRGDLTAPLGDQFWKNTQRDSVKFNQTVEKYVRSYLLFMITETNQFMNKVYSRRSEYTSRELAQTAVSESVEIVRQWEELGDRVQVLQGFLEQSLQNYPDSRRLAQKLSSFKRNIAFTSVYPSMMMMMYYLSDVHFEFTLRSIFYGEMKIVAAKIVRSFFIGTLDPWLYFGDDGSSLSFIELLYALQFALRTETFTAFGNIPSLDGSDQSRPANVDEYQYFNLVLSSVYDDEFQNLVNDLKALRKLVLKDSEFTRFKNYCRGMSDPQNEGNSSLAFPISNEWKDKVGTYPQFDDHLDFRDLTDKTFMGNFNDQAPISGLLNSPMQLYSIQTQNALMRVNDFLVPQLRHAENMISVLKDHFDNKINRTKDPVERARLVSLYRVQLAKVEGILQMVRNNISATVSFWINAHGEVKDCLDLVGVIGRKRSLAIYDREKTHLRMIHSWMRVLEIEDPGDKRKLGEKTYRESLNALHQLIATDENPEIYQDLLRMLKKAAEPLPYWSPADGYLDRGLLEVLNERLASVRQHPKIPRMNTSGNSQYLGFDKIEWSANRAPVYIYSWLDFRFRMLDYYHAGIAPNIYRNVVMPGDLTRDVFDYNRQKPLLYLENFDTFLASFGGIIGPQSTEKPFIGFWGKNINFDFIQYRETILRQIYYMGSIDIYPNVCADKMISYTSKNEGNLGAGAKETGAAAAEAGAVVPEDVQNTRGAIGTITPECARLKRRVKVTAKDLVETRLARLAAVDLWPGELNMLRDLQGERLYPESKLAGLILDTSDIHRVEPLFNPSLQSMIDRSSLELSRAFYYHKSQKNLDNFILGLTTSLQQRIKCSYLERVESNIALVTDYQDAILVQEREDREKFARDRESLTVHYGHDGSQVIKVASVRNSQFTYLEGSKIQDLRSSVDNFHLDTSNFFNRTTAPADPDAADLSQYFPSAEECHNLYSPEWSR